MLSRLDLLDNCTDEIIILLEKRFSMKICNRILRFSNCIIWCATLVLLIYFWDQIPMQVPMHYDLFGIADNFGDKEVLIGLFVIETFIFLILSAISFLLNNYTEYSASKKKVYKRYIPITGNVLSLISNITFSILMFKMSSLSNISPWLTFTPLILVILLFCFVIYKVNTA